MDGVEMVPPERHTPARSAGLEILNTAGPGMQKGLNRRENHAELLPQIRRMRRRPGSYSVSKCSIHSITRTTREIMEATALPLRMQSIPHG